ncbi:signal peptide peptidase SppA [Shouchella shacheensis]|uniref:signal peptide peptidase SppA n=1 Tax=Shouchella shacheensis TaxID=1649580 RepID=UPI00073FBB1A|nr:signal peptide peptidase SppA [Shouchella shacheensis]
MKARRWIALGVSALVLLVSGVISLIVAIVSFNPQETFNLSESGGEVVVQEGSGNGQIALLDVNGLIINSGEENSLFTSGGYNHQVFLNQLTQAMESNPVEGIVLNVDSPGGGVLESAQIHDLVVEAQEEYDKPVYISMGGTAASGGYYLAAPAERIFANAQTLTGSIGVIMSSYNISELLDNIGVEEIVYKSGPFKDILSPTRDATEEEENILQGIVDEYYDDFVNVIADGRGMSDERVRELGDGRVYTGEQALEEGLVDEIGTLDDTIKALRTELGGDYEVISYTRPSGMPSWMNFLSDRLPNVHSESDVLHQLVEYNQPRALYLQTFE